MEEIINEQLVRDLYSQYNPSADILQALKLSKNFEHILKNKVIKNIERKSKYIVFYFGNHLYAILHLGMSGTLHIPSKKNITNLSFYSNPTLPKKHNHIIIDFEKIKLI